MAGGYLLLDAFQRLREKASLYREACGLTTGRQWMPGLQVCTDYTLYSIHCIVSLQYTDYTDQRAEFCSVCLVSRLTRADWAHGELFGRLLNIDRCLRHD